MSEQVATIPEPLAAPSSSPDTQARPRLLLDPRRSQRGSHVALAVLLLTTTIVCFWRAPADAGGRLSAPDGAEYAVAAHRLATLGTLDIDIADRRFPSRYPPLFSTMMAPVYAMAPGEIGNGIVLVFAFALLMAAGTYVVGWQLAGPWGALLATSAVIHHGLVAELARTIMSDLPVAALAVVALALFLRMGGASAMAGASRPCTSDRSLKAPPAAGTAAWLAAGLMVAIAAGLRPLAGCLLFPFLVLLLFDRRRFVIRLTALLAPVAMLVVAMGIYNHRHFGSWSRTGYHFWCPIPYEFPSLTWSTLYLEDNFWLVLTWPWLGWTLLAGAVGLGLLFLRKHALAGRVAWFVGLAALPISAAHLYYFHREPRFHAVLVALCCVVAGCALAVLLPQAVRLRPWAAVALAAVGLVLARPPKDVFGSSRPSIEYLAVHVPPGGTIVSGGDPVPLDPLVLRPGGRHWLPVWRRQNYAGHAIAPRRIELRADAVLWPGTHRPPVLMEAGAVDAVPWTATERPDLVAERIRSGTGVYFDLDSVQPGSEALKRMERLYEMRPIDPQGRILQLLSLRPADESATTKPAE